MLLLLNMVRFSQINHFVFSSVFQPSIAAPNFLVLQTLYLKPLTSTFKNRIFFVVAAAVFVPALCRVFFFFFTLWFSL